MNKLMPAIFIGHGSPINALEKNEYHLTWQKIGREIPKPRAILSISAHWQTKQVSLTGAKKPETIHDFWGFPQALFQIQYPAPGSDWLVGQVLKSIENVHVDTRWGLDHGTWSVLHPMFPGADIAVVQLSLARTLTPSGHFALGKLLGTLRQEGVLLLGSGNMVHNLSMAVFQEVAFDWALDYDACLRRWILERNTEKLINFEKNGPEAKMSINSAEHYLPLLYILGASQPGEAVKFYCEKVTLGSVSMRCVQFGGTD